MAAKCEDHHAIDLAWLRRKGLLKPGCTSTIRWSRGGQQTGAVTIGVSQSGLLLAYRVRPAGGDRQDICEVIPFTETRTNFGGTRRWLQYLTCSRACRVHKVRERLGHYGALDEPFPPKPKGMHWKTYKRLQKEDRRYAEV